MPIQIPKQVFEIFPLFVQSTLGRLLTPQELPPLEKMENIKQVNIMYILIIINNKIHHYMHYMLCTNCNPVIIYEKEETSIMMSSITTHTGSF